MSDGNRVSRTNKRTKQKSAGTLPAFSRYTLSHVRRAQMSLKMKVYVVATILFLLPLIIIPIHRAHQVYNLSYADVLYNLIVNRQFAPK